LAVQLKGWTSLTRPTRRILAEVNVTIGIVTISYNQSRFLQEAIASVQVRGPHSLEYVIVDPGSTDGSAEIIHRNAGRFSRIITGQDSGPADGLNKGFAALERAEICGYINADDRFAPGALDTVIEYFLSNPTVDILLGSIRIIDEAGRPALRARVVDKANLQRFADHRCFFWQQATFFRMSSFRGAGGFNTENSVTWDGELVVDMLLSGARPGHTRQVLGDFRVYGGSITGSKRLVGEAERQHLRIASKIAGNETSEGCASAHPFLQRCSPWLYRLNPYRHLANVALGLYSRTL